MQQIIYARAVSGAPSLHLQLHIMHTANPVLQRQKKTQNVKYLTWKKKYKILKTEYRVENTKALWLNWIGSPRKVNVMLTMVCFLFRIMVNLFLSVSALQARDLLNFESWKWPLPHKRQWASGNGLTIHAITKTEFIWCRFTKLWTKIQLTTVVCFIDVKVLGNIHLSCCF